MSFFRIEEKNNLKTISEKPKKIKTYTSIEEIMNDVEAIKTLPEVDSKDKIIDMIYKLIILYRGYRVELPTGEYDPKYGGYLVKIITKDISDDAWDAIDDVVGQLKDDFSEEELFKRAKRHRKDMYIGNFLYGDDIGTMISLFYESTSFDSEYEIANSCTYEYMEKDTCDKMEKSAKEYLVGKSFIKK